MIKRLEIYENKKTGRIIRFWFNYDDNKYISEDGSISYNLCVLRRLYKYISSTRRPNAKFRMITNINGFKVRENNGTIV